MATIDLSRGYRTLVDDDMLPLLSASKWFAQGKTHVYAARDAWDTVVKRGRRILMHRFIVATSPSIYVDHINGDTLDNRRSNLRLATHSQNNCNSTKRGSSRRRFKGVYWHPKGQKWMAAVTHDGKSIYLGLFTEETEAALAYDAKARDLFGEFSRLNFPSAS